ncbi:MAG: hypothetical protein C4584_01290 [Armatimonadetes bacterium]|nr:MAG: hypothetical protein C4584_01290 [Armatimonadota bacterium]
MEVFHEKSITNFVYNLEVGVVKYKTLFLVTGLLFLLTPFLAQARVTPEDIVNSKKEAYQQKVQNYSLVNQQKLADFSVKIADLNKEKTGYLTWVMEAQANILDEYEKRDSNRNQAGIEKARYWITYAHEAVAYQAAKIYIFNLRAESNIKNDVLSTINLFDNELESTRKKVIYSQSMLGRVLNTKD